MAKAIIETTIQHMDILTEAEEIYLEGLRKMTGQQVFICLTEEKFEEIITDFYRYWHNTPGTNTTQGFQTWWKDNKQNYLKHPHKKDINDGNETW